MDLSDIISSTGAIRYGIAKAEPVPDGEFKRYSDWLNAGCHGTMTYMERYNDVRRDPRLLLPGAQSIIMVAFPYYHNGQFEGNLSRIAAYAHGDDYHEVIRRRLSDAVTAIISRYDIPDVSGKNNVSIKSPRKITAEDFRICVDTAPLLERYWAVRSGVGFIGRNHLLIVPGYGSYLLLGAIITTIELSVTAPNLQSCLGCDRCIAACPAKVLDGTPIHKSNRCLSYLTIEYRGELPESTDLHGRLYGCDICQQVCPHNKYPTPTSIAEFDPRESLRSLSPERAMQLCQSEFSTIMRHSAIKRTKLAGLQRNARCILDRTTTNSDPTSSNR